MEVALLTGGSDRSYAFGLAMALAANGVRVEVIGSDAVDSPEMHTTRGIHFINVYGGSRQRGSRVRRALSIGASYVRLFRYTSVAAPRIFHILWNNKFETFDRTVLMLYYKLRRRKIVLTAHNVNAARRDATNTYLNWLTLKLQYRLADHLFVHTEQMREQLQAEFGVCRNRTTIIPFGLNNAVPNTRLTPAEAKQRLGIAPGVRTILFFGAIKPYKGLEYLLAAFNELIKTGMHYRLLIVGELKKGSEAYAELIRQSAPAELVTSRLEFVPDADTEIYFKAADVTVLPYKDIFQSGVLVLAYTFGLPVVATDVGSFREQIIEGRTGFVCKPGDPLDLAKTLERYFNSDVFRRLDKTRLDLQGLARCRYSWQTVGEATGEVYRSLLAIA